MGRTTDFFGSAVKALTIFLSPSAVRRDDSLSECDELLQKNEQPVEQLTILETQGRELRYAARGIFNHLFKEAERWLK